jgi:hypothetical protein
MGFVATGNNLHGSDLRNTVGDVRLAGNLHRPGKYSARWSHADGDFCSRHDEGGDGGDHGQ